MQPEKRAVTTMLFGDSFDSDTRDSPKWREEFLSTLAAAEAALGERDPSFTINCIVMGPTGKNRIELGRGGNSGTALGQVTFRLERRCWRDPEHRAGILAHEVVHFLNPIVVCRISCLEEGVAEHFASDYYISLFGREWTEQNANARYRDALNDVRRLTEMCPLAIMNLRGRSRRSLSVLKSTDLLQACPACPPELAKRLTQRFYPPSFPG